MVGARGSSAASNELVIDDKIGGHRRRLTSAIANTGCASRSPAAIRQSATQCWPTSTGKRDGTRSASTTWCSSTACPQRSSLRPLPALHDPSPRCQRQQAHKFRLRKASDRMHIVEGLLKALDAIDAVIKITPRSKDSDEARTRLMASSNSARSRRRRFRHAAPAASLDSKSSSSNRSDRRYEHTIADPTTCCAPEPST